MKNYLLIAAIFSFTIQGFSQTDSTAVSEKKLIASIATIQAMDGKKTKGWFYKMNDDSLSLLPVKKNKKYFRSSEFKSPDFNETSYNIPVTQINTIALQKRNAGTKGALIGLGVGILTGVITGLASGDDPVEAYQGDFGDIFRGINNAFAMTAGQKALAGAIVFGGLGSLTGFILGKVAKKKFIIGGQKNTYRDLQGDLMKRLIIK
jgi:hypothetical protein